MHPQIRSIQAGRCSLTYRLSSAYAFPNEKGWSIILDYYKPTLRFITTNRRGSCRAQGGNFTSWTLSPVFCCTPKSMFAEFSRNLLQISEGYAVNTCRSVLRTGEELWNEFSDVSADISSSRVICSRDIADIGRR